MRLLVSFLVAISLGACAGMPETGTPLEASSSTALPQPADVAAYCARQPSAQAERFWQAFCEADAPPARIALTQQRWDELQSVQTEAEASVIYSVGHSWDPLAQIGDCKTFASRMALLLLNRGWPAGALRIATAFVNDGSPQQGASHAVLLVDTDRGTIVLDSRQHAPMPWQDLSYIWLSAEVPGGRGKWSMLTTDVAAVRMALLANLGNREQVARWP